MDYPEMVEDSPTALGKRRLQARGRVQVHQQQQRANIPSSPLETIECRKERLHRLGPHCRLYAWVDRTLDNVSELR